MNLIMSKVVMSRNTFWPLTHELNNVKIKKKRPELFFLPGIFLLIYKQYSTMWCVVLVIPIPILNENYNLLCL